MSKSAVSRTGMTKIKKSLVKDKKTLLTILTEGNTLRSNVTLPITDFKSSSFQKLVVDMIYTMNRVRGVGLAATQIGKAIKLAIAVIDRKPLVLVNPKIVEHSNEKISIEESCLSCPGKSVKVNRWSSIIVQYNNFKGVQCALTVQGIDAIIIQHELDHLDGKLITDYDHV